MGFIEDDGVTRRQQFGESFVFQHDVSEEQMVIDDDDIGCHRLLARIDHEAVAIMRAFAAETVIAGRGDL